MTRSSSAGAGSRGSRAASGCAPALQPGASGFTARLPFLGVGAAPNGRDSPKNEGGDSRHSSGRTAATAPTIRRQTQRVVLVGRRQIVGNLHRRRRARRRVARFRLASHRLLARAACDRRKPDDRAPSAAEVMLGSRDADARGRHRIEHGGVILRRERSQRQPDAGPDQAHLLHGPLDRNRIALAEQGAMQRLQGARRFVRPRRDCAPIAASHRCRMPDAATFAVTEITPSPPCNMNSQLVASSPLSSLKLRAACISEHADAIQFPGRLFDRLGCSDAKRA